MSKIVLTITGPSASGKSHLERALVEQHGFARIISHTTRQPRPGEENGKDYYFMSREIFLQADHAGEFVEVVEFGDNLYGGSVFEFDDKLNAGVPVVVVCEPNGRDQIRAFGKKNGWTVIPIYVSNPGNILAHRMVQRFARELADAIETDKEQPIRDCLLRFQSRLATAMTTEFGWRNEVLFSEDPPYDLIFLQYDETTDKEVVETIKNVVKKAQDDQPVYRAWHYGEAA